MLSRVQIQTFQDEESGVVCASISINGGPDQIWTKELIIFTGRRFLRSALCQGYSPLLNGNLTFPEHEEEAARAIFAMMQSNAPDSLDVSQLQGILKMCRYSMADGLVVGFKDYLKDFADAVKLNQVCQQKHQPIF